MRMVIEREGGFSIVEDADAITEIDVTSDAVVLTIEVGGDKWTTKLPVSSHAEACRVSAAIAVKCGELVEPLAKGPDEVKASEWVTGEPPRDGRWYVVVSDYGTIGTFCRGAGEILKIHPEWMAPPVAHLPTPIPER